MSALHQIALPPSLLKKGFWIYIWRIRRLEHPPAFYVGMTGDAGSFSAQSPLNRFSAHLGTNERSNALRRYLAAKGIEVQDCQGLDFAAYGPIGDVPTERSAYRVARTKIAALEKRLWQEIQEAGMDMLNRCPTCKTRHDHTTFAAMRAAFAPFFKTQPNSSKL